MSGAYMGSLLTASRPSVPTNPTTVSMSASP